VNAIDPSWAIAEQELRWFFRDAASACGLRSSMGSFVDILRAGVLPGENTRELRETPDTVEGLVAGLERDRKRFGVFARARRVHQLLDAIGVHHARTLELAYGCENTVQRVSLSLVADCSKAISAHRTCVDAVRSQNAKNGGTPQRGPKQVNEPTVRDWVLWLMTAVKTGKAAQMRGMLDEILGEATQRLDIALVAYCEQVRGDGVQ